MVLSVTGAVDKIPLFINPEVCGLNPNALFGYHNDLIDRLWENMIKLYPNVDVSDGKKNDWDEVVQKTAEEILQSLPEQFDIKKVKTFYGDKCVSPNIVVLLRELEKCNVLLEVVRNTLSQLAKVLGNHFGSYRITLYYVDFFGPDPKLGS